MDKEMIPTSEFEKTATFKINEQYYYVTISFSNKELYDLFQINNEENFKLISQILIDIYVLKRPPGKNIGEILKIMKIFDKYKNNIEQIFINEKSYSIDDIKNKLRYSEINITKEVEKTIPIKPGIDDKIQTPEKKKIFFQQWQLLEELF